MKRNKVPKNRNHNNKRRPPNAVQNDTGRDQEGIDMSAGEAKDAAAAQDAAAPKIIDVEVVEIPAPEKAPEVIAETVAAAPAPDITNPDITSVDTLPADSMPAAPVEPPTPKPDFFKASVDAPEKAGDTTVPPPPASSGGSNASTLAIAALLLAGVAVAQPLWAPHLPGFAPKPVTVTVPMPEPAPVPPADPAIKAELKALADKLAAVEAQAQKQAAVPAPLIATDAAPSAPPSTPMEDPRVAGLTAELAALKAQLTALVEQQATAAAAAKAAPLPAPLPALPGGLTPAVALAIGKLQSDITLGQPFTGSLKMLRDTAGGDAAIAAALETLQPLAAAGVPTLPVLRARFAGLGSDIIRAAHRGEGADWLDKVGGTLATLVTVRRYGDDIQGSSVEAVTGRAEEAVAAGKLDQAVAELSSLTGPAAETAGPWLNAAKARLSADLAAKTIADRAFAVLAAADKGGNAQ